MMSVKKVDAKVHERRKGQSRTQHLSKRTK